VGRDRGKMGKDVQEINLKVLNLGCGYKKMIGATNVDAYKVCDPDVLHDLNNFPYPWEDGEIDRIYATHVFEHLEEWWKAFKECSRVLKKGGIIEIRVPDVSNSTALSYRDHLHVFTWHSFNGTRHSNGDLYGAGANAWAEGEVGSVPFQLVEYIQVPFGKYEWMIKWCPWVLNWCANHLRNFIHEQCFIFKKIGG